MKDTDSEDYDRPWSIENYLIRRRKIGDDFEPLATFESPIESQDVVSPDSYEWMRSGYYLFGCLASLVALALDEAVPTYPLWFSRALVAWAFFWTALYFVRRFINRRKWRMPKALIADGRSKASARFDAHGDKEKNSRAISPRTLIRSCIESFDNGLRAEVELGCSG